jgi:predicted nucleotidyltransferase
LNFPLERHTIFLTIAGSHAHGTARDGSDVDLRGVCIAPLDLRLSLFSVFEQYEGPLSGGLETTIRPRVEAHASASRGLGIKIECVVFDIAKFVGLCAAANPNALEILFADEADWVLETPAWRRLHGERQQFLTKKVQQTFVGYAMAQLRKIKTHRSWLLHPPARKPARQDFGLPAAESTLSRDDQNRLEQSIADKVRTYGIDDVDERLRAVATNALGLPSDVVAALNAEKQYRAAMKHWDSYETWKSQRNRARAELEQQHGYDTKHAMHLIRLMRMGLESLERGDLLIRRPDATELAAIREGAMTFDELLALAERLQHEMERAAATTNLPDDVDRNRVDELAFALMAEPGV